MKNQSAAQYATLKKLVSDGRLGNVQAVSVTVNGGAERAEYDLAALLSFVGSNPADIRYVVSREPYAHGSLTAVFENAVLARYIITDSPAAERTDWHVYSDKTELYSRAEEEYAKIIPVDLFPDVETVGFISSTDTPDGKLPAAAVEFCRELCGK